MEMTEYIGMAIVATAILLLTAQTAYAYGLKVGGNTERLLSDRRVRGVLDYENKRKPKSRKNKLKAARRRAVGSITVQAL